tara:strand:+ start:2361 stop:2876 length:516 start_codon:yes stop_codon:yes gene_type:complete
MKTFNEHCECAKESKLVESNIYRVGSEKYFEYWRIAREQYQAGELEVDDHELDIMESDLGTFAHVNGHPVPLDCILEDDKQDAPIGKPMRGGPKKYYVYVRDPSSGNVKKVTWGDTTGLKVKLNDPAARKSFAARHKCDQQNDKTKAAYWACRLPRYAKQLGLSGGGSFFW